MPKMTEDQIERRVETSTNAIDASFMAGRITQEQYDKQMRELAEWADKQSKR